MARGRTIAIVSTAAVLAVGAAAGGAYYVLHTRGTPDGTAQRFVAAWQAGDAAAMARELATPQQLGVYEQQRAALGVERTSVRLGRVAEGDGRAGVPYTVTLTLKNVGDWSYDGRLDLVVADRAWKVDWSPAALHPRLTAGAEFSIKTRWPRRAEITDADGGRIDDGTAGGSVQQLVGYLGKATKEDVAKLGSAYKAGQPIGRAGLQQTFQKRLAGTPSTDIRLGGETLETIEGSEGEPVRTSLDPRTQAAAVTAVKDIEKPTSMVAIRPSTGEILAVVNNRGGFNRALDGRYAPGSTFKAVTAIGLLAAGMSPEDTVACPEYATVGGLKIRNSDNEAFGSLSFLDSFAHSCNTTFAPLAQSKLGAAKLMKAAESVGFNQPLTIGVPATPASFPKPQSDAELAAEAFGQARITASPLSIASVAAAIADGTWRPPTLVPSLKQKAAERALPDGVKSRLHTMMAAVVTKGTAKKAGLPAGTHGKTGTAEYNVGDKLETHAWFMGFKGDVAFAVIVEGGGGGGAVAAPVAATFLKNL
ncbi:Penicillin-binding protein A [Nonomuraea coxensis DSM 45129]|uniref:Penicillin-binding protein A n=1 Tax=Nonomuraea coxensis DSM 45129 TaxID=1122611 RepID=A0ABX8U4T2_9ACTN|nr:penicillin-binding transpeptidase domain-containing protein [Nonomuraea coxensis]QYC42752.1 Penicillin-binding protein A [Nonomuraea coxensis DSM 45129]